MCKRLTALALLIILLVTALPASAAVSRYAVVTDGAAETLPTRLALQEYMLYTSWQCDFLDIKDEPDLTGYDALILCLSEDAELSAWLKWVLATLDTQVFVIGSGGLRDLAPDITWYEGDVLIRCEVESGGSDDLLINERGLWLMPEGEGNKSLGGTVFIGGQPHPLCQTRGSITHLAWFDAQEPLLAANLATCLQAWQWPYKNAPTAYGQYLVLEYAYPYLNPAEMMDYLDMLESEAIPYALAVTPIFAHGEYPAMKRFCEFLRYAQSRGAGIILRVPFVKIEEVNLDDLVQHMKISYEAYAMYGVYPLAIQAPIAWLQCEKGLQALSGYRTVFLFETDDELSQPEVSENLAYRDGHQIVAPAWSQHRAFTSSYAQAIYVDTEMPIDEMRQYIQRLKSSRRVLKGLHEMENVVYSGDYYVHDQHGVLQVNGVRQDKTYVPFTYEEHYTFDRGITQFFKEQIETSNRWLMIFVVISCTIFIVMMVLFRKQIRRELVLGKRARRRKQEQAEAPQEPETMEETPPPADPE